MIQEILEAVAAGLKEQKRARRYREVSAQVTEIITQHSQQRVSRTLADAYLKATGQGSTDEDRQKFGTHIADVHIILSKDNASRIRQWTESILEEEERFIKRGR